MGICIATDLISGVEGKTLTTVGHESILALPFIAETRREVNVGS